MPNGGQHFERVGACPHCDSYRIRTRRRKHENQVWRCRSCNKTFATPRVVEVTIYPNTGTRGLVFAGSIKGMERRKRSVRRRPKTSIPKVLAVLAIVAVLGFAGWAFIALGPGSTERKIAQSDRPAEIPAATPTATPFSYRQLVSESAIVLATPTPEPPIVFPSDLPPAERYLDEKEYMLAKINYERRKAGVKPVTLGDNIAAQLHAESALDNCFASHWGIDGLKPYMRYSLAGGYQSNAENGHGSDYCISSKDRYTPITNIQHEIDDAMEGWMDSPGHRRNLLDPAHRKVNIGLAWNRYDFKAYQHFEGDYIEFDSTPTLEHGVLTLSGSMKNTVSFEHRDDLDVQVYFDRAPHPLTPGQVARTYCYGSGMLVADLRPPLSDGSYYSENTYKDDESYRSCPDPYDIPPDAPAPTSLDEAHEVWQEAYDASQAKQVSDSTVHLITAREWIALGETFFVEADLSKVIDEHRHGVYSVVIWGKLDGADTVIAEFSLFHDVVPPMGYTSEGANGKQRTLTRYGGVFGMPH